ncbi:histidinol dehydrogenase [Sorangium sp. So ce216]
MLPIYIEGSPEFESTLSALRARGTGDLANVTPAVTEIIDAVRRGGTSAVLGYIEKFERRTPKALVRHAGPEAEGGFGGAEALARLTPDIRAALETAAARIARYHERQRDAGDLGPADASPNGPALQAGFSYEEEGVLLGMRVRPLRRVGVYAPGGKARYPSSVLMSAIPARIAGVREIVLASPSADDVTLAAAHLSGVTTLLDSGGAQAIAAMAYGLAELAPVDKIVGPGNAYVACAKRLVFGDVSIDGITGPSEILVLADDDADPRLVAADLLSQAEHDEASYALLATTSAKLAEAVARELDAALPELTRRAIVQESLSQHAAALVVGSRARLAEVADQLGVEHVAFHVADAEGMFSEIGTLGAALLGSLTPVAAGDYLAGPSHVLPTGNSARFGAPLGVYDFVTRASLIRYSGAALRAQGPIIEKLALAEGLQAHARAVTLRLASPALDPAAKRDPAKS